jgi:two-component system sensor histidine kinase KdpD
VASDVTLAAGDSRPIQAEALRSLIWAVAATVACTLADAALNRWFGHTELVMVYVLGIVVVAERRGRLASVVASILSVASFNFWFVPPFHTFAVADVSYALTLAVMLLVGITISGLTEQARRRADEAHAARLEAEKESLRSSILSSVSHDLRTPLATIFGAASTLRDDGARLNTQDRARLERLIFEEAERMDRLVSNLLDMSRLEAGGVGAKLEWTLLEEVIGSAVSRCEPALGERRVNLQIATEASLVRADPVLLEQVFVNLFDNVAKHAPASTCIDVDAEQKGENIVIRFGDDGPGLPPEEWERVFDKFHRGRASAAGSGLGLSICRGVLRALGGTISAHQHASGGLELEITLPWSQPPELPASEEA